MVFWQCRFNIFFYFFIPINWFFISAVYVNFLSSALSKHTLVFVKQGYVKQPKFLWEWKMCCFDLTLLQHILSLA